MTTLTPELRTIRKILVSDWHVIPDYQRSYAWTENNLMDFWEDITNRPTGHFLGSVVVTGQDDDDKEIVDGQQRLTTALIALSAIRDKFSDIGAHEAASGIHKTYIYARDEGTEHKPRLRNESTEANNRIEDAVFSLPNDRRGKTHDQKESLEAKAYNFFLHKISQVLSDKPHKQEALNSLKEQFLKARIIYVLSEDRNGAFRIFETLNDRGTVLEPLDLIKNFLFQYVSDDPARQAVKTWNSTSNIVDQLSLPSVSAKRFAYYAWNSRTGSEAPSTKYVLNERLLRSVMDYVSQKDESKSKELALEIVTYFNFCASLLEVFEAVLKDRNGKVAWKKLDPNFRNNRYDEINRHLYGILVTEASQPIPLLLSLFYAYFREDSVLSSKMLKRFLEAIHKFQFRWTIAQKNSTENQRKPYRLAATTVFEAGSAAEIAKSLSDFEKATISKSLKPTDKQFKDGLKKLRLSNENRKDYFKILFILSEIGRQSQDAIGFESTPTIEHLKGQSNVASRARRNYWIFKMGNLIILPSEVNESLPSDFSQKSDFIHKYVHSEDKVLLKGIEDREWTSERAGKRLDQIADIATEIW